MPQNPTHNSLLWYGEQIPTLRPLGLVVPNPGRQDHTNNATVQNLVADVTQHIQAFMITTSAQKPDFPAIKTVTELIKAVSTTIKRIEASVIAANLTRVEGETPEHRYYAWKFFPVPLYGRQIQNRWLRRYAEQGLSAVVDMMHSRDNDLLEVTLTQAFADAVLPKFRRLYGQIAVDLFNKDPALAFAEGFSLTNDDVKNYDPAKFIPEVLVNSTLPRDPALVFTNYELGEVLQGVEAPLLPAGMNPFPNSFPEPFSSDTRNLPISSNAASQGGTANTSAAAGGGSIGAGGPNSIPTVQ